MDNIWVSQLDICDELAFYLERKFFYISQKKLRDFVT